ncbi:MAG: hypothetical protein GXO88_07095 [Chlorobi bacterium]|nr:hypothetical protein [Chlorobiota bacterium]
MNSAQLNKTRSYIIYAIGEILLITIGILIALSVNNWNKQQTAKEIEIKTLGEIHSGLTNDLKDLQFSLSIYKNGKKSSDILMNHMNNRLPYNDSLDKHFGKIGLFAVLSVRTGPFETLKSRGMETITNDSLRLKIANLYDLDYNTIIELQKLHINYYSVIRKMFLTKFKNLTAFVSASPINYEELLNDNVFQNDIKLSSDEISYSINTYESTITKCKDLLFAIEEEIDRLNNN